MKSNISGKKVKADKPADTVAMIHIERGEKRNEHIPFAKKKQ